tara:strand:+ start:10632 stop:11210 length:579 start_codon:yes stop_codon:yes gene_type:complete
MNYPINFNNYNSKFNLAETEENSNSIIHYNENNLYFQGSITPDSCFHIQQYILKMQYENYKYINFHIQSMGGSLLPTFGVIDDIHNSNIPINTYINGFVASAGSLISVSGNTRYISKNSLMLIHSLRTVIGEVNFNQLEDNYLNSKTMMNLVKNIYKEKSIMDDYSLDFLLQHDYWLNSTECLKYKLVDFII